MADTSTTADRIVELNEWALDHYSSMFPRSWAPDYLRERLGTDLADDPRYQVGYAPPGPTSLIQHLTARGAHRSRNCSTPASPARQSAAGWSTRSATGSSSRSTPAATWSGSSAAATRRRTHDEFAGPKYLNTRGTAVFTKGEQLYRPHRGRRRLAAGATPVLVEGPMDAIAVTIATGGEYVGIAPLGTAFTEAQAAKLKPYLSDDPSRIVIATDPDSAGWQSAQRAFWRLAALRAARGTSPCPKGSTPPTSCALAARRHSASASPDSGDFAQVLIDRLIDERLAAHADAFSRVDHGREARPDHRRRCHPSNGWCTPSTSPSDSTCRSRWSTRRSSRPAATGPTNRKPARLAS